MYTYILSLLVLPPTRIPPIESSQSMNLSSLHYITGSLINTPSWPISILLEVPQFKLSCLSSLCCFSSTQSTGSQLMQASFLREYILSLGRHPRIGRVWAQEGKFYKNFPKQFKIASRLGREVFLC